MKVLVVGSGGREHAICTSVAKSPRVDKIYCAPGNAGIAALAECVPIGAMEFDKLVAFAKEKGYKNGYVLWPIRTALSGKQMTPAGATEILEVLGKEESIKRIQAAIEKLGK